MASMAFEWIQGRNGERGVWWLKLNGTCLLPLELSEKATDTELRMLGAQRLSDMANAADVFRD